MTNGLLPNIAKHHSTFCFADLWKRTSTNQMIPLGGYKDLSYGMHYSNLRSKVNVKV